MKYILLSFILIFSACSNSDGGSTDKGDPEKEVVDSSITKVMDSNSIIPEKLYSIPAHPTK